MSGPGLAGLLLAATLAGAQLEARLSPGQITVGDRVEVELLVRTAGDAEAHELEPPAWGDSWGEAEILALAALERSHGDGELLWRQVVTVTAFRPGTVELPPIEMRLRSESASHTLTTPGDLTFEVRSLLAEAEGALAPRPPEAPRRLPVAQAFWWSTGVLALACLAAAIAVARRRRPEAGHAPALDPLTECRLGIEAAASREPASAGFTELSSSLRTYLARRLEVPARESTTPELGRLLAGLDGAADWLHLLARCDEARFCGSEPDRETLRARCGQGRRLVESLEAALARSPHGGPR